MRQAEVPRISDHDGLGALLGEDVAGLNFADHVWQFLDLSISHDCSKHSNGTESTVRCGFMCE